MRDPRSNSVLARALAAAASLVVVVLVFALALPSIARYGAAWSELRSLRPVWLGALAAAVLSNTVTSALPWKVLLPRLGLVAVLRITQASTALISLLPGGAPTGMALSFAMLRNRQVGGRAAGLTVALAGTWSQLSTLAFPVVALAMISTSESLPAPALWAALAGIVLIVAVVLAIALALGGGRRALALGAVAKWVAATLLRPVGRPAPTWTRTSILRLRRDILQTMREHGLALTLATLANQLTGFAVLDLSLRAVGIPQAEISLAESFTAWALTRLIESLPLTPGGLGLVELGLTGMLIAFGGAHAPVVAAVLLYRGLVLVPTLALGGLSALTWRVRWSS